MPDVLPGGPVRIAYLDAGGKRDQREAKRLTQSSCGRDLWPTETALAGSYIAGSYITVQAAVSSNIVESGELVQY